MKNKLLALVTASVMLAFTGCSDDPEVVVPPGPEGPGIGKDYAEYKIRQVLQYDPVNTDGINIGHKFDFFETVKMILHFDKGLPIAAEFTKGTVPFEVLGFEVPPGKHNCELNMDAEPYELILTDLGKVLAVFEDGEFVIDFKVGSRHLDYRYTFKTVD